MDIFLIIGIVCAFGSIIFGYILEGGHLSSLFLLSPSIIVIGGTISAVIITNKISDVLSALKALKATFTNAEVKAPDQLIALLTEVAQTCRTEGLLAMEKLLDNPEVNKPNNLTLKLGMIMALEMKSTDEIEEALYADVNAFVAQRQLDIGVWSAAGGYSPTFGIIGTVMGLVHVLGNMEDPDKLVVAIGAAFIATLYGVVFANLLYLPFAGRIKGLLKREQILKEMMISGICMIVNGEPPRVIENKLSIYYQAFPGGLKKYKAGIEK